MAEQRRLSLAVRQLGTALITSLRTLLPVAAALLLWQSEARATHAMGGELTYECVGPNLYRVQLNFYRDCNGVAAPTNCSNGRQFRLRSTQCSATVNACFGLDGVETVTPICLTATDRCTDSNGDYGIQRYRYSAVVNLSAWAGCGTDWIIDWDLCCRNNAITSLNNPGSRNLYLTASLNNTLTPCNNSPRYLNDPTPFACVGQSVSYNHGFNDVDGDSLSFELAPALGANGSSIPYSPGYSFLQPVVTAGGANAVQINPVTGTITFVPSIQQFSVVTVRVREWRNGVQIGTYLRDVQFAIIACTNNLPSVSGVNGTNQYIYTVCAGESFCFNVNSADADPGQNVTMTWNNGIPGATFNTTTGALPVGTFCWTPTAANIGQNLFAVNVADDACALNGVNNFGYVVQVTPPFTPANAGPDQSVCGFTSTMAGVLPFAQVQGTWTVVSGSGVFANANSPTSAVSGLSTGANVFRWTVDYQTCGTTSDEVTINAFNPGQPAASAGPDQSLCQPTATVTLAANVATTPAIGTWTLVSGTGTFANANSPTSSVSGLSVGANTFRWTIDNGACTPPTSDQVTIFLFSNTQPAAAAGPDQQLCQPTTVATLAGNAVTFPATGLWTVVNGTGTFANATLRNTTVSGLSVGVNTFRWTITNGPCTPPTTQDEVNITLFNAASPAANAGPDQQVCATTGTLAGNAPLAPATGQWSLVSGTGTITTPNSPTSAITGLGVGANVFQWTLNNGPCANGVTTDQVTITRFDATTAAAVAGPDQDLCSVGATGFATATMAANASTPPATGVWTIVSGGGTITTANSPNTTITNIPVGVTVLRWTINNGPCTPPTTTDDVTIRVFDRNAAVAAAGPDQDLCAPVANVTLAANAATAPGTGVWTVVSGTGTFANASSPTTTVSGMSLGSNVYRWTLTNGACPGAVTSDEVRIRLFDPATAAANAGTDQQLCGTSSTNLSGNAVNAPAVGTWTLVSGQGTIVDAGNAAASVTDLGVGVNVFRWSVNNGPCGSSSDEVSIVLFDPNNAAANAGPDQSICVPVAPNVVTMAASAVTFPAVGTWTVVSGSGTIVSPNSPTTQINTMGVGINEFRWTVSNGPCPAGVTNDVVRVLVFDAGNPVANAGPDVSLCTTNGTITMAGSTITVPASGQWTLVSGTGTITNPTSPTTTITGLGVGQSIFQWTVNNGPCANGITTDQMSVFIYDPNNPSANAGADQSFCTPLTSTTMSGSAVAFPASGVWTVVSGSGTITNINDPNTTITALGLGTNQFAWTVNNGVCPNGVTSDVVNVELFNGSAQAADAGTDQSLCGTSSTAVMNATPASGLATGSWSVVQGTATFSDVASPTATVSGLSIGVNILRWSINNGACGITTDQVTILVYDPNNPVAAAGADQELCTPTTSTTLQGSALIVPAVGTWTLVSGSGTIANPTASTTAVSGLALGANVFRWQVNNGACTNPITQDEVTIFVFDLDAPVANAGPDQEICTPVSSISMAANSPVASAVGTWTLVSGGGTIVSPNSPNSSITGLPVGINVFAWTIDNGPCGTTTDQVRILVFSANNAVANAGLDEELCTPESSTTLLGSLVTSPATGQWVLISGQGTITDPTASITVITGLGVGENIFQWTVSNGPCANGITSDRVSVFVFDASNPVADAGADQEFCTPVSSTSLSGSPVIFPATSQWELVSGQGTITDPNDPNTTVTGLGVGVNIFRYRVENGPCDNGITEDLVSILLFDANNAPADAGADQELCTPNTSTTMQGSAVTVPALGTWTLVSGGGTITDPNDPNTSITGLPVGVNVFAWTVQNGPCADALTTDQVSIIVFDESNPVADAGADQELCTPNTITTLTGSALIFPATGTWTLVSGQGTISSPNASTTTVTDLGVGENIFAWTVSNGPCANGITTDQVSILLFDQSNNTANAGPDRELCFPASATQLEGSAVIFPAVGTWTLVSGSGTLVDANDPNTFVLNPGIGENIFQWTVDNGPCESGAGVDQMSVFVFDPNNPVADAGDDQEHCTANLFTTQLEGSAVIFPAVGTWTLVSGTGTIADPNDPNTTVFDIAIGESVFLWTVSNGPCANGITTDEVRIRIFDSNNPNAVAGDDQEFCTPVSSAVLTGSAVTFPAIGTWTVVSGPGVIADVNNPNTTITDLTPGVTVVAWTVSNGPCDNGITSDQLIITLYDQNNPIANAGTDQELCTPTGTTISTDLQGSAIIFPAVGTWSLVNGTGTIVDPNDPNSAVDGLSIGENLFLWTVTNGVCNDPLTTDLVSIFVFDENNPDAVAGPNQQICTPVTNAFMQGSPVTFPAQGTWVLTNGQGTIVDPNDPLTEITDLGIGVNTFSWTVDNGSCPNGITSDVVTLILFDAQAPPADAGADQELCSPDDSATITGNPPVGAAFGTWNIVQGSGSVADPASPSTTVSGMEVGETILTWTLSSGICVTTVDSVSIFVFDPNNLLANAGLDQELCVPQDSVFMAGSALIFPAQGTWTLVSGTGVPLDPNDPGTLISGLSTGENIFQWEVYNGPCLNSLSADQVTITLFSDSTSAANAGPDLESCLPVTAVTLQGEQPIAPGEGTWTLIAGTGNILQPNNPNSQVTGLSQGVNTFVWTLEWDPCPNNGLLTDTVNVLVYNPNAPLADAGPDQQLCSPADQTVLAGNTPEIPGVGTWTVISGPAVVVSPNDPASAVTGLTVGVHELVWTIYNGQCGFGPPSTDTLIISVFDGEAPDALTGNDISWCTPQDNAVLNANDAVFPGVGTWTLLNGSGTFANVNDPNTAVFGLPVGQHDYLWTIDNGICGTSSDSISVFIFDGNSEPANAGIDKDLCTPNTTTDLNGNAPVFPATGLWTVVSGTAVFDDPTSPTTAVSGLSIGTNVLRWTITNEPCGTTSDDMIITVFDETQASANAGPDQQVCTPTTSTTLQGSAVSFPAVGTWVFVSGTGTISDPNAPNATLSGLSVGQVVLRWTVDNGPCANGSTFDDVVINIFDGTAPAALAGDDQAFCTPIAQTVTMFASSPIFPAIGTWTLLSGAAVIASPNDPFTAISDLGLGENVFAWTIDNGACGSSSDEVSIAVFDHTVPPADAGDDQEFCQDVNSTRLDAVPATSTATGTWALIAGAGDIALPNDAAAEVTGLPLGNNWFTWTITNGPCPASTDSMLVTIKDCLTIIIPNAFSPNGDGVNDVLVITNIGSYPENRLQIFNRYGNLVLDRAPYNNDWDGRSQTGALFGDILPESTYYYVLDLGNDTEAYTGYIYLRR
jgi:gliding motility-associated-like protein